MATPTGIAGPTGIISQGAAAAGASAPPTRAATQPAPPTRVPSPTAAPGSTAPGQPPTPTLNSLEPSATTAEGYDVTNANATDTGAAPTAQASEVSGMADIKNGLIDPNDPTNSASQVNAITASDSPYIQQAKQQGYLSAAARGMGNSSLAAGASEASAVQAAAPLAEENASTAASGKLQNSQLKTQANEFNASEQNANQQLNAQMETQTSQFNAANKTQEAQVTAQTKNQMTMQTQQLTEALRQQFLQGSQAQTLAAVQGQWNDFIQSHASAAALYQSTLSGINTELNNKDLSPARVASSVTAQLNLLNQAFKVMSELEGGGAAQPINAPPPVTNG